MTTFQVECSQCKKPKWPCLAERPVSYVCVLCRSLGKKAAQARQEMGQKAAKKRWAARG